MRFYEQQIREALLENYDRISLPVENLSVPINVSIDPQLYAIIDVVSSILKHKINNVTNG